MSNEVAQVTELTPEQAVKLEKIQAAWGNLADVVYRRKISLELQVQNQQLKRIPVTVEALPKAEIILREMKSARSSIVAQRLEVTNRIGQISDSLMLPEKELEKMITEYSQEIITAKREHEKNQQEKRDKDDEIKRIKEQILKAVADNDSKYRTTIVDQAGKAFSNALGEDVKPGEDLGRYLTQIKSLLGASDFHSDTPSIRLRFEDNMAEANLILDEHWRNNPHAYAAIWEKQLAETFANYDAAYVNKQAALEQAEQSTADQKASITEETANVKAAAEIGTAAQTLEVISGPVVRPLKQSYEIDMPDTFQNAFAKLRAFLANKDKCLPKADRVKNWDQFTPGQAGKYLAAVKCDDNGFTPEGIVFKVVDKL